jgi:hypothetical protein
VKILRNALPAQHLGRPGVFARALWGGRKWEVLGSRPKINAVRSVRFSKSALYIYGARCALLLKARSANQEFSIGGVRVRRPDTRQIAVIPSAAKDLALLSVTKHSIGPCPSLRSG